MKPLNLALISAAATVAALQSESSDAFTPNRISVRQHEAIHPSSSSSSRATVGNGNPSRVVLRSSPFDSASPNDQIIREEYSKWRQKYGKGEFNAVRYENFKANFMAVTVRNNMERTRARQNGEAAPSPIALNEFGDCSANEYRTAMGQQQQQQQQLQQRQFPQQMRQPQTVSRRQPNQQANNNNGLQPSNTMLTPPRRPDNLTNASAQLRNAVQQRNAMEAELAQMKQLLEQKKKMLADATREEEACQERLALREEQRRLLNDRLVNGWEDERGMNNYNM